MDYGKQIIVIIKLQSSHNNSNACNDEDTAIYMIFLLITKIVLCDNPMKTKYNLHQPRKKQKDAYDNPFHKNE